MRVLKPKTDDLDELLNARIAKSPLQGAATPSARVTPPNGAVGRQTNTGGATTTATSTSRAEPPTAVPATSTGAGRTGSARTSDGGRSFVLNPFAGGTGGAQWTTGGDLRPLNGSGHDGVDDDVDLLAQTRADHERERKAAEDELKAAKAKALQAANARASLGGLGLSGATAALNSDIGRMQDRTAIEAMSDLGRKQRDEDFQAIQRQAAIDDLEDAQDEDVDGDGDVNGRRVDGKIGDGNPDNDPPDTGSRKDKETERNAEILDMTQPEFEQLTQEELIALGWEPEPPPGSRDASGRDYVLWTAPSGKTRRAYIDDFGEKLSNGLEWQ